MEPQLRKLIDFSESNPKLPNPNPRTGELNAIWISSAAQNVTCHRHHRQHDRQHRHPSRPHHHRHQRQPDLVFVTRIALIITAIHQSLFTFNRLQCSALFWHIAKAAPRLPQQIN